MQPGDGTDQGHREPGAFWAGGVPQWRWQAASPPVVGKLGGKGLRAGHCGESFSTVRRAAGCKVEKGVVRK